MVIQYQVVIPEVIYLQATLDGLYLYELIYLCVYNVCIMITKKRRLGISEKMGGCSMQELGERKEKEENVIIF